MLPWQTLCFWRERSLLDPALAEDALIVPCKGILKICAMSLPDLWSRNSLKDVEGFDHSSVNETLGACGDLPEMQQGPFLPLYLWQCGQVEELSRVYQLMDFNFSDPIHSCLGKLKRGGFSKHSLCHGFAIWIDWVLDEKSSNIVSTGPDSRYGKQGVQLLSVPQPIDSIMASCVQKWRHPLTT